jgi:hypothetical protein
MWDKPLFALRRIGVDLGGRLGSWRLSIVLMVLAALYYALLAIWARSSPPHVVRNIASLLPFWIVYVLLLVNTGVCLWNRLPLLRREISKKSRWAESPPDWQVSADSVTTVDSARRCLRRLGYRPAWESPGRLGGIRQRWAGLGTYLFHGAFFLVAIGFFVSLLAHQEASVWVTVGEAYRAEPDQFLTHSPPRLLAAGVPALEFRVARIRPEFWRDELLFTTLEAELELPDGDRSTTRINWPLIFGTSTFLRLSGFGYAPRYEIVDRFGHVLDSAFVKLNVFPPGQRDYFSLPNYPHRIYLELFPDLGVENGTPFTRSLNLVDPGIALRVFRGRVDLGQAVLRPGDGFDFEGLTLRFPEIRYWGEFSIVRDPGIPVLFLGYFLGLIGLALKLRGRRREIEWRSDETDSCFLVGWGGEKPSLPVVSEEVVEDPEKQT